MDALFAYCVRSIKDNQPFDHTYVTSSRGDIWPCPDGCTCNGGDLLAKALGDRALAECLSHQKRTPVQANPPIGCRYADLEYGIDGVCHQMSNRILYATNNSHNPQAIDVDKARAALVSYFFFGKYGSGEMLPNWPRLHICTSSIGMRHGRDPSGDARMDGSGRFDTNSQLHGFQVRFDAALGADHVQRESVMLLAKHVFRVQSELRHSLVKGQISRENYLSEFNRYFVNMLEEIQAALGPEEYQKLFGNTGPKDAAGLIDPGVFLGRGA